MANEIRTNALTLGLFGLMASLPFLVPTHQLPIPSFQSEWLAILLGVAGMLALLMTRRDVPVHLPHIAIAPLALIAVVVAQLGAGMFAYAASAFTVSMYLLWSALLAIAGRTLVELSGERKAASWLSWFLLVGGLANAVFGILQYLQWSEIFGDLITPPMAVAVHGVYGNLGQQNHFSTHIALALASAGYLYFLRQLTLRWLGAVSLILLVALLLSGSRSGFLHLTWIGGLGLWLLRKNAGSQDRSSIGWRALAICMVLVLMAVAAMFATNLPLVARMSAMSGAFGPRIYLWNHAWSMFLGHPLLGAGFDAFASQLVGQLQQLGTPTAWGIDQYAHNLGLQLLAVAGLCGFAAVAIPWVLSLHRQLALQFTAERMWLWSVLGVLLIHSMLEQPLYYAYFLGITALVAGMAEPSAWTVSARPVLKAVVSTLLLSSLGLLFKTAADYDKLEGYFYSARYYNDAGNIRQLEARRNVVLDLRTHSILSPYSELVSPGDFVPGNAPAAEKIALNTRVMHYAPIAEVEFRQAALLAEAGRIPDAIRQFDRAAYAYPNEMSQYLERFNALAAADPSTYAQLAAHANEFIHKGRSKDTITK